MATRSRPNGWEIKPHGHAKLSHIFLIRSGSGRLTAESGALDFTAPCAVLVPAGMVHGFVFEPESEGQVLTIAKTYLDEIAVRHRDLDILFTHTRLLAIGADLEREVSDLNRDLNRPGAGQSAAVEGRLLGLLSDLVRLADDLGPRRGEIGPAAGLVARFRNLVEQQYRSWSAIEDYCAQLGVTPARLRDACLKATGEPPIRIIHDRLALEARRALLFSDMTISEVAFHLGFSDPAYFSRFFSRAAGVSPRAFRNSGGAF